MSQCSNDTFPGGNLFHEFLPGSFCVPQQRNYSSEEDEGAAAFFFRSNHKPNPTPANSTTHSRNNAVKSTRMDMFGLEGVGVVKRNVYP